MVSLAAPVCFGATVKMASGITYQNVTVLRRDASGVEIQTQFGTMLLPMSSVVSIDGVSVRATPAPVAAPTIIPGLAATGAAMGTPAPRPSAMVSPAPSAPAAPAPTIRPEDLLPPEPTPVPWPAFVYEPNMDFVILGVALFAAMWIGTAGYVQRSLYERKIDPRFWGNLSILLPGAGFVAYEISRRTAVGKARRSIDRTPNEMIATREKELTQGRPGFTFLDEERKAVLVRNEGETTGLENAQDLLQEAVLERASDVHIDPSDNDYLVRFRIDGIMQPKMNFDKDMGQRVVSALKTLAQIDVAEKRKAQDGRFRVQTDTTDMDFRVATANSIFGEKMVIRILNRRSGLLGLDDLGMPEAMMEQFARVIHSRSGIILATGPTGSGKTSTLYSALSQLDSSKLNIMSIEDPVEYGLPGATQLPVNPKAGITFESGLKSILRQDPDVIFVGEMRDAEAAQVALRAALTGHLVFSSLHTRDAVGTIIRLEEMGTDRHLLASSLLVLIAQRLVRVLCPECRVATTCKATDLDDIGIELPDAQPIFVPKGCKECAFTGYLGRTGIFEMIVFDDELRDAVNRGEGEAALTDLARAKGFSSFRVNGAEKVLQGITSIEEVLQAS